MITARFYNLRGLVLRFCFALVIVFSSTGAVLASGLIVNSFNNDRALEYDPLTGEFVQIFTQFALVMPEGIFIDSQEDTFISSSGTDEILIYDGPTAALLGVFVTAGSGGLDTPTDFEFGPGGDLYVASFGTNEILRYNGNTGDFIEAFVTAGAGGLNGPTDLIFTSNKLLVASRGTNQVLEYDPSNGDFRQALVPAGSGGLSSPESLLIHNNNLLVASFDTDEVLQYDRGDGTFLGAFVTAGSGGLDGPTCLSRGQQGGGQVLVCSFNTDQVLEYSRVNGAFLREFITAGSGSLDGPTGLFFKPGIFSNNNDGDCSLARAGEEYSFPYLLLLIPFILIALRRLIASGSRA